MTATPAIRCIGAAAANGCARADVPRKGFAVVKGPSVVRSTPLSRASTSQLSRLAVQLPYAGIAPADNPQMTFSYICQEPNR
jgi:hypothetical protein